MDFSKLFCCSPGQKIASTSILLHIFLLISQSFNDFFLKQCDTCTDLLLVDGKEHTGWAKQIGTIFSVRLNFTKY